jgi:hypothetical protein
MRMVWNLKGKNTQLHGKAINIQAALTDEWWGIKKGPTIFPDRGIIVFLNQQL